MKFGKFAKEWSRKFSERVPRRDSIKKDDSDESRPEKTEHLYGCLDSTASMRKIEDCQACWDSQE